MFPPKINSIKPLEDMKLFVTFRNGVNKVYDVKHLIDEYPDFEILRNPSIFNMVKVDSGGCGVSWNDNIDFPENELWVNGILIP